jgi:hypothetical protein
LSRSQLTAFFRSAPVVWSASFLIGYAFHSIKGVNDPETFWVGNLSWPYLLIPALACAGNRSLSRAVAWSAGSCLFMVLGFYNVLGLLTVTPMELGMEPGSPRPAVLGAALSNYLRLLVLGVPGGIPWITVAVLCGAVVAALHHLAARRRRLPVFWSAIALVGLLEPILHFAPFLAWLPFGGYAFDGPGRVIAATECGLALLALYYGRPRRSAEARA